MTATLSSAFAGLFFSSSSQLPLSRRLQTLTLIPYSYFTPIVSRFPRESVAVFAAWRGVEKDSSTEERIEFDADEGPTSIDLVPIAGEEQFDRVVAEAQQLEESIVVLWMAKWCRKCIYLKPKLEKLAADYHPRIRFYCVDVNSVPQKLVNRAEIKKMPTIQLWRDSQKQAEVIGGHKAWLVIDEVRRMVKDED